MIRIVTDTGANLPRSIIDEFGIIMVTGHIIFGDEIIAEYPDLPAAEFYRRLTAAKTLPTNRDSTAQDFKNAYRRALDESPGASILSLHVSEALAVTIGMARLAAASFPLVDIRVFDTRSVTLGQGLMVYEAARMARDGADMDAIMRRLEDMRSRMRLYLTVDTLEYLSRGGRVGRAARVMGGLLNVKPILTIRGGMVQSHSQQRSRARAIAALRDLALEGCAGADDLRLGIMHAVCEADARRLADELQGKLQPETLLIAEIGAAVGVHTGPGALGVCWYAPEEN